MTLIWLQISSMSLPLNKHDRVFLQQKTFSHRVNLSLVLYKVLNPLVSVRVFKLYDQQVLVMFIYFLLCLSFTVYLNCANFYIVLCNIFLHILVVFITCVEWVLPCCIFVQKISFPTLYVTSVGYVQSIVVKQIVIFLPVL